MLEAEEKAKKFRRFGLISAAVMTLGMTGIGFMGGRLDRQQPVFQLQELSPIMVEQFIKKGGTVKVTTHEGIVTVENMSAFTSLLEVEAPETLAIWNEPVLDQEDGWETDQAEALSQPEVGVRTRTSRVKNQKPRKKDQVYFMPEPKMVASLGDGLVESPSANTFRSGEENTEEKKTTIPAAEATSAPLAIEDKNQENKPKENILRRATRNLVPVNHAEKMPEYPGGLRAMQLFLDTHMSMPQEAEQAQAKGTVYVRFVVNPNGNITHTKVLHGIGYGCDEEALRLVKKMPRWIPGSHKGKKVPIYKTIAIYF